MAGTIQNNQNFTNQKDTATQQYTEYIKGSGYSRNTGVLLIPIAGEDGIPPLIVKVHAAYGTRLEKFETSKKGNPPVIPAPVNTPSGDILMRANLVFMQPTLREQQTDLDYAAQGEYLYIQSEVRDQNSNYPTGQLPFVTNEIKDGFDEDGKGFYQIMNNILTTDPNFFRLVDDESGSNALKGTDFLTYMSTGSSFPNGTFNAQTTTYFPQLFKEDAIA